MASEEREQQIAAEARELENAPSVPLRQFQPQTSGGAGRCHWCGRFSTDLVLVEVIEGFERYKGVACCGGRHV